MAFNYKQLGNSGVWVATLLATAGGVLWWLRGPSDYPWVRPQDSAVALTATAERRFATGNTNPIVSSYGQLTNTVGVFANDNYLLPPLIRAAISSGSWILPSNTFMTTGTWDAKTFIPSSLGTLPFLGSETSWWTNWVTRATNAVDVNADKLFAFERDHREVYVTTNALNDMARALALMQWQAKFLPPPQGYPTNKWEFTAHWIGEFYAYGPPPVNSAVGGGFVDELTNTTTSGWVPYTIGDGGKGYASLSFSDVWNPAAYRKGSDWIVTEEITIDFKLMPASISFTNTTPFTLDSLVFWLEQRYGGTNWTDFLPLNSVGDYYWFHPWTNQYGQVQGNTYDIHVLSNSVPTTNSMLLTASEMAEGQVVGTCLRLNAAGYTGGDIAPSGVVVSVTWPNTDCLSLLTSRMSDFYNTEINLREANGMGGGLNTINSGWSWTLSSYAPVATYHIQFGALTGYKEHAPVR